MVHKRLLVYLFFGFILATIIGTLSHESGHYLVAESLGFDAGINYRSTFTLINEIGRVKTPEERFLIILGGPLQTMLTGTIGLMLLFWFRKSFQQSEKHTLGRWIIIFISLFWLRQPANFVMWIANYLLKGKLSAYGDEVKISRYLQLPDWFIGAITGLVGFIVLAIVIFRFVPKNYRFTFILSGLTGGIAGCLLWFEWLGKVIMP